MRRTRGQKPTDGRNLLPKRLLLGQHMRLRGAGARAPASTSVMGAVREIEFDTVAGHIGG